MKTQVIDVPDRQRYEIVRDGTALGYAAYQKTEQLIVFTHTEVDPSLEGQGIGGRLVQGALDHVRDQRLAVLPITPTSTIDALAAKSPTDTAITR
jgi:predicted GNAT family acetyltransferase